jgi:hypothetical protein
VFLKQDLMLINQFEDEMVSVVQLDSHWVRPRSGWWVERSAGYLG